MTRTLAAALIVLSGTGAWGAGPLYYRYAPTPIESFSLNAPCMMFSGVLTICSDPPTIWISPDVKPPAVAKKFLDALIASGFRPIEKR